MRTALLASALALSAAGCAGGEYVYKPVAPSGFVSSEGTTAKYVLPASAPQGSVRVDASGIETITNRATDVTYHALHLQLTVANRSGTAPWTVAPYAQVANVPARGWTAPFLAASDRRVLEHPVQVAPGTQRTFDLYYALPRQASKVEQVPDVTLAWQVALPAGLVREQTTFARQRVPLRSTPNEGYWLGDCYYDPLWSPFPSQCIGPGPRW